MASILGHIIVEYLPKLKVSSTFWYSDTYFVATVLIKLHWYFLLTGLTHEKSVIYKKNLKYQKNIFGILISDLKNFASAVCNSVHQMEQLLRSV